MSRVVIAAHARLLRNPNHEAFLARYWRDQGTSAAATADEIAHTPYDWHITGNVVMTHEAEEVDMERIDVTEDPFTYAMDGHLILVEKVFDRKGKLLKRKSIPLLNPNWAFGKDRRRTMNRFFAKAENPSHNRLKASQLSLMFWADVSWRIREDD